LEASLPKVARENPGSVLSERLLPVCVAYERGPKIPNALIPCEPKVK